MAEFRMPSLGADMEAGVLVEWTVRPGDHVRRGDVIALVETDKGLIEIEVFDDGVVESLVVAPGTKVPVGSVLAILAPDARTEARTKSAMPTPAAPPAAGAAPPEPPPARPRTTAPPAPEPAPRIAMSPPGAATRPHVSPYARRRAAELGIDLARVAPGEGGVIRTADVERAADAEGAAVSRPVIPPPPAPRPVTLAAAERFAAMRRAIATAMARSKRDIPHYYLETHIDMSRALTWLAERNRERPVGERLLHSVLLLKAVARATHEVPEMNGFWIDGAFRPGVGIHVGVAISLRQGGLVAPALHDVDEKPLDQLMAELLDLTTRARKGILRGSEVADATITVTNLGDQGVESVLGVIYPPQVALVGFGRIVERPWACAGIVAARPVMAATLAGDHRASDGRRGGRFLGTIDRLIQEPEKL